VLQFSSSSFCVGPFGHGANIRVISAVLMAVHITSGIIVMLHHQSQQSITGSTSSHIREMVMSAATCFGNIAGKALTLR
jgi:hypothetical protein